MVALAQAAGLPGAVAPGDSRRPGAESAGLATGSVNGGLAVLHIDRQSREGVGVGVGVGGAAVVGARDSAGHRPLPDEYDEVGVVEVRHVRLGAALTGIGVDQLGVVVPDRKRVAAGDGPLFGARIGCEHR